MGRGRFDDRRESSETTEAQVGMMRHKPRGDGSHQEPERQGPSSPADPPEGGWPSQLLDSGSLILTQTSDCPDVCESPRL